MTFQLQQQAVSMISHIFTLPNLNTLGSFTFELRSRQWNRQTEANMLPTLTDSVGVVNIMKIRPYIFEWTWQTNQTHKQNVQQSIGTLRHCWGIFIISAVLHLAYCGQTRKHWVWPLNNNNHTNLSPTKICGVSVKSQVQNVLMYNGNKQLQIFTVHEQTFRIIHDYFKQSYPKNYDNWYVHVNRYSYPNWLNNICHLMRYEIQFD